MLEPRVPLETECYKFYEVECIKASYKSWDIEVIMPATYILLIYENKPNL